MFDHDAWMESAYEDRYETGDFDDRDYDDPSARDYENMTLARQLMTYAEEHYNDGGWDVIVECYELETIAGEIDGCETLADAIAVYADIVGIWSDRQADAENSAF